MNWPLRVFTASAACAALALSLPAQQAGAKPRARDLGVPFDGTPGPLNAITDVAGVEVGHTTLISGEGKDAVRTGVTVVLPKGKKWEPVFAGWFAGNGFGELTGTPWVKEGGVLGGPVAITNTYSVGTVRDAVLTWFDKVLKVTIPWHQPVVGETTDASLNDIAGFHVREEHVWSALNGAQSGPVAEGNVGGGTGMVAHGFKGGIGTASRTIPGGYTVGVLVQANYGSRELLTIAYVLRGEGDSRSSARARWRRASGAKSTMTRRWKAAAKDRSSWSSRPTLRCCRVSSSAWLAACQWESREWAGPRRTAQAICSSRSQLPIPGRQRPRAAPSTSPCCRMET